MLLGQNIRYLRKQKGLSRAKLAQLVAVNPRMITFYETGDSEPRLTKLLKLSDIFEVTLDDLIKKEWSDK